MGQRTRAIIKKQRKRLSALFAAEQSEAAGFESQPHHRFQGLLPPRGNGMMGRKPVLQKAEGAVPEEDGLLEAEIQKLLEENVFSAFEKNPIALRLVRRKMKSLHLAGFCQHRLPDTADKRAVLALAALTAAGWIAYDLLDGKNYILYNRGSKREAQKAVAKTWSWLPKIVRTEYKKNGGANPDFDAVLKKVQAAMMYHCITASTINEKKAMPKALHPMTRAHNKLLAYSLVSLRFLCPTEEQFLCIEEEMKDWMNWQKNAKKFKTSEECSLEDLELFRVEDGGFKFVLLFCLAAGGVRIDAETLQNTRITHAIEDSGLHLAFLLDILSYRVDKREMGGAVEVNMIEYLRLHCSKSHSLEEALRLAARHINYNMLQFNRSSDAFMESWDDDRHQNKAIINCCRRQIDANALWFMNNHSSSRWPCFP